MTTKRWLIPFLLLLTSAAQAQDDDSVAALRQRLAARLADKEVTVANPRKAKGARPARPAAHPAPWSYSGAIGPEHWATLSPEYRLCGSGRRQSPIDLRDGVAVDQAPIGFDYQPSAFSVLDDGHTIQAQFAPGNALTVMGRRYELQQIHFHHPSEERVDGQAFDMVAHLEHRDAEGRIATLAVLLQAEEDVAPQPVVQAIWAGLPLEKGEALRAQASVDPGQLLPAERGYFAYMGSQTTPPCSEGVLWLVLRQPVRLSRQQLDVFAKLYPMNARPLQPAAGRLVKQSLP